MATASTHPPSLRALGVGGSDSSRSSLDRRSASIGPSEQSIDERVGEIYNTLLGLDRRVTGLDENTTTSVGVLNASVDGVKAQVAQLEESVASIKTTVEGHTKSMREMNAAMGSLDKQLSGKISGVDRRLNDLTTQSKDLKETVNGVDKKIDAKITGVNTGMADLEKRMNAKFAQTDNSINEVKAQIADMGGRITTLEKRFDLFADKLKAVDNKLDQILRNLPGVTLTDSPPNSPYSQTAAQLSVHPSPSTSHLPPAAASTSYLSVPAAAHPAAASTPTLRTRRSFVAHLTDGTRSLRNLLTHNRSREDSALDALQRNIDAIDVEDQAVYQPSTPGASSRRIGQ
ncbi:hypothetical protein BV20DRAFT_978227 [Pilatotrama ljubarskyi]|nr:hypothetical protein BV20DRAFT_978227 [Pilatotrama ljubarskyi]